MFKLNEAQQDQVMMMKELVKGKSEAELRSMRDGIVIMGDLQQTQFRAQRNDEAYDQSRRDTQVLVTVIDDKLFELGVL